MKASSRKLNWRATMGDTEALPLEVVTNLDINAQLAILDGEEFSAGTARMHTCRPNNPLVILDYSRRRLGTRAALRSFRLCDRSIASVMRNLPRRTKSEVLQCQACQTMEAELRMEQAVLNLVAATTTSDFRSREYGRATSAVYRREDNNGGCNKGGHPYSNFTYIRVKQMFARAREAMAPTNINLNGDRLMLRIQPPEPIADGRIKYGLAVCGSQATAFQPFRDFAHQLFTETGIPVLQNLIGRHN